MNEPITALEHALRQQNVALDEFKAALDSLGDVELHVPTTFIEELDEIAARCAPKASPTINGLRG